MRTPVNLGGLGGLGKMIEKTPPPSIGLPMRQPVLIILPLSRGVMLAIVMIL